MIKYLVMATMVLVCGFAQAKKDDKVRKPASVDRNVMVGGETDMDACGGYGIVLATTTLISFKSGQMAFDKVDINTNVSSCDSSEDGEYVGIVFGKKGQNCGVGTPVKTRQEYKGPCKRGWIKKGFFELLAG